MLSSPIIKESLAHGQSVANSAMAMFEGLKHLHKLNAHWGAILRKASELHDIGWLYGKRGHHKASASMIRAGQVEQVPKDIRHLVALVARYHRRAEPSEKQWRFAALTTKEQKAVRYLAAIIRLADALDFSHSFAVKNVQVKIEESIVYLMLSCNHDCQAEIDRVQVKKELFVKIFAKDVCAERV